MFEGDELAQIGNDESVIFDLKERTITVAAEGALLQHRETRRSSAAHR
jgi:hypothetical protein